MLLLEKEHRLEAIIAQYERVGLAFSGGADSSLILRKALDVLGPGNVLVLTARSCLLKKSETERAATWLERHGYGGRVRHETLAIDPLSWDEFVANPPDRCYRCKLRVYRLFAEVCACHGIAKLIDGTNYDDLHSDRPGLRALEELNVGAPLAEAEMTKEQVRGMSRVLELDTWDHPSASCLATRIPDGLAITRDRIEFVGRAESFLETLGFYGCRVRLDREGMEKIYIQVMDRDVARLAEEAGHPGFLDFFNDFKVKKPFLDLSGR